MSVNVIMAFNLGSSSFVPARELRVQFGMLPTCRHHMTRSLRAEAKAKTKSSAAEKAAEKATDKVAEGADKAKKEIKEKTRLGASGRPSIARICMLRPCAMKSLPVTDARSWSRPRSGQAVDWSLVVERQVSSAE